MSTPHLLRCVFYTSLEILPIPPSAERFAISLSNPRIAHHLQLYHMYGDAKPIHSRFKSTVMIFLSLTVSTRYLKVCATRPPFEGITGYGLIPSASICVTLTRELHVSTALRPASLPPGVGAELTEIRSSGRGLVDEADILEIRPHRVVAR